jgi:signal transduction histidine kinase
VMGAAGVLNENQEHFLSIIKTNADRLTMLVNDLLDIGRIDTQRVELDLRELELARVVQAVIDSLHGKAAEKSQILKADIPSELPPVVADPDRLVQVLTNLIGNAQQYTPTGGHIAVTAQLIAGPGRGALGGDGLLKPMLQPDNGVPGWEPKMVRIDVSDDGIGIAPEDQERIFERFFRSDHPLVQETTGTGLGLSITKSLIEMHGGMIWVGSEQGTGSTFSFTLPVSHEVRYRALAKAPEVVPEGREG